MVSDWRRAINDLYARRVLIYFLRLMISLRRPLLLVARLVSARDIAPDILRLSRTARLAAFAAAVRMVNRVHGFAADGRPDAEPPRAACFSDRHQIPFRIRNLAEGRKSFPRHAPDFAGREPQIGIAIRVRQNLDIGTGRSGELPALARHELYIVNLIARPECSATASDCRP